jgi:hypothetical protein
VKFNVCIAWQVLKHAHLNQGNTRRQDEQRSDLGPVQLFPEQQHAEQGRCQDLRLVGHLKHGSVKV